jgi:hypothetical protein
MREVLILGECRPTMVPATVITMLTGGHRRNDSAPNTYVVNTHDIVRLRGASFRHTCSATAF